MPKGFFLGAEICSFISGSCLDRVTANGPWQSLMLIFHTLQVKGLLAHVIDMFFFSLSRILSIKARIWPLCTSFLQLLVTLLMIKKHKCVLCHQVCMQVLSFGSGLRGDISAPSVSQTSQVHSDFGPSLQEWFRMTHF